MAIRGAARPAAPRIAVAIQDGEADPTGFEVEEVRGPLIPLSAARRGVRFRAAQTVDGRHRASVSCAARPAFRGVPESLEEEQHLAISKRLLALGASAAIIIAACGLGHAVRPDGRGPGGERVGRRRDYCACVAFDTGGLGDKNFNDLAKKGLDDAKAEGFTTHFSEATGSADYAANIQRLIDRAARPSSPSASCSRKAAADAAKANPDIAFAQVDTAWNDGAGPTSYRATPMTRPRPPNFTGLDYQIDQASMLAGYLAAAWSKTGKVATYGGLAFPGVTRFMDGFYAGVQYYNQEKDKAVKVVGWDGSAADPDHGRHVRRRQRWP